MGADKNCSPRRELDLYPKITTKDSHTTLGRTVRGHRADGPLPTGGRSVNHNRMTKQAHWITDGPYPILGRSASNWCRADSPRRPGGRSAKHLPAKNSWLAGSKQKRSRMRDEHEEHLDELHHADSPPATRGRPSRHGNSSSSLKLKTPKHLSVHGSPKRLKLLRKDLGKTWSIPRGCYAPKLGSSNKLNRRESNRHRTQPKT
jgi:hypothetical protein